MDCNCTFKIENPAKQQQVMKEIQSLDKNVKKVQKFMLGVAQENQQIVAQSAYELQQSIEVQKEEYYAYIRKQTIEVLDCDEECVNDCTNPELISFNELPQCMKYCYCPQNVITFDDGEYNYPALIEYSQHNKAAWSLFKMVQEKLWIKKSEFHYKV